jgi:hypothetical protein
MYSQAELTAAVRQRLAHAGPPLPADADLATAAADALSREPTLSAFAVLRELDPAGVAGAVAAFTAGLPAGARSRWRQAFTRTVFLTGNPANLADRFTFDHVAEDGAVALTGPHEPAAVLGLRRLLPLVVDGDLPPLPSGDTVRVPGRPPAGRPAHSWRVTVATAGVGTAGYLVHLGHVVAEAVLDGHIHPGDRLLLRHVPRLLREDAVTLRAGEAATLPVGDAVTLRVHADRHDPTRLRAYAAVCPLPA